jgi:hypothetical protein
MRAQAVCCQDAAEGSGPAASAVDASDVVRDAVGVSPSAPPEEPHPAVSVSASSVAIRAPRRREVDEWVVMESSGVIVPGDTHRTGGAPHLYSTSRILLL